MRETGIPPRYWGACFATYQPKCESEKKHLAWVMDWCHCAKQYQHGGFALIGPPGVGKTLMATCVIASFLGKGYHENNLMYVKARALFRRLKSTWSPDREESEAEVLRSLRSKGLLVVDEIDKNFSSPAERVLFHEIMDDRWDRGHPTIVIGNLMNEESLARVVGRAVMSRMLSGGGRVLIFEGEDKRR